MANTNGYKGKRSNQDDGRDLTSRPFQQLRGMQVGPSCLACQEPIVLKRQGNSGHGWLHSRCEGQHTPENGRKGRDGKVLPLAGSRERAYAFDIPDSDAQALLLELPE